MLTIGILFIVAVMITIIQSFFEKEQFIFVGTMGDKFELAGNWSCRRVPGPADDVFILYNSYPKLTIQKETALNNFIVQKGWAGVLTIEGDLTISGCFHSSAEMYSHGNGTVTLTSIKGYSN